MTAVVIIGGLFMVIKMICSICRHLACKLAGAIRAERNERIRFQQKQEQMWMEQARADERRDAQLAKHEEQINKLRFQVSKATADIQFLNEQINQFYGLLDIALAEQAGAVPGSKSDIKYQKQILALTGKIHTMEQKLNKAEGSSEKA